MGTCTQGIAICMACRVKVGVRINVAGDLEQRVHIQFVPYLQSKEFIAIEQEQDIPGLAREMVLRWFPRNPSGILSLVSGTDQFHTWKRDDFRSALQAGIVKVCLNFLLIVPP